MAHFAITDCPLRTVVNVQYSKIGGSYPRIFVEDKPSGIYYNFDLTLNAVFNMKASDFEDWWADATPISGAEICKQAGFNFPALKSLVHEVNPLVTWE